MMLRRAWLLFAQTTTVGLALLFVVSTLRPQWLARAPVETAAPLDAAVPSPVAHTSIRQVAPDEVVHRVNALGSYADAAMRAMPAVVNVYSAEQLQRPSVEDLSLIHI